jgi:anaerobic magnesium-protoporphyrin IX monomethyl ester cyclase
MKVLLVAPNYLIRDEFGDPTDPPIGIASIAALLESRGICVTVIDANAENLSLEQLLVRFRQVRPDVVGISCNYSPLHNPTLLLAQRIKMESECLVVVGGNHAAAMAEHLLAGATAIDYIVRGEGEVILPELLASLEAGRSISEVKGISYRSGTTVINTPDAELAADLEDFPLPAYHLLPMHVYKRYNIIASRGCPFQCSYCASNTIFKRKVRYRSAFAVVDEIEHLITTYGNRHFWFSDDTFTSRADYTHALLDEIIRRNLEITWSCLTRVNRIDKGLLDKMKKSGCAYISYGIESGNAEMLHRIGKKISVADVLTALEVTHAAGIRQYGFFIVGFPGETQQTILDSYKLIFNSKLDGAAFNILIPLPGTRVMNELLEKGIISLDEIKWDYLFARTIDESYEDYAANLAARWTELTPKELIDACKVGHKLPEVFRYVQAGEA